jgi:hypothetical protein
MRTVPFSSAEKSRVKSSAALFLSVPTHISSPMGQALGSFLPFAEADGISSDGEPVAERTFVGASSTVTRAACGCRRHHRCIIAGRGLGVIDGALNVAHCATFPPVRSLSATSTTKRRSVNGIPAPFFHKRFFHFCINIPYLSICIQKDAGVQHHGT